MSLDADLLRTRLTGTRWHRIEVVEATGSTNADLVSRAAGESVGGTVRITTDQTAGRGRHARTWTAPAGTQPPGWEWLWELEAQGPNATLVRHTYDWSKVTDKDLLKKVSFPLVTEEQLEDTLGRLAAAVSS